MENRLLETQARNDRQLWDKALREMEEQSALREAAVERDRATLLKHGLLSLSKLNRTDLSWQKQTVPLEKPFSLLPQV